VKDYQLNKRFPNNNKEFRINNDFSKNRNALPLFSFGASPIINGIKITQPSNFHFFRLFLNIEIII